MWRPLPGLLLCAVLAGAPAPVRAGPPEEAAAKALADPTDPGHEKALEAWTALTEPQRVERVLAGIASEDRQVARFYAALADPYVLSLEELRRVMAICAEDPEWVADPLRLLPGGLGSNGLGFGTPDLPGIAKTAATTPDLVFFVGKDGDADEFHRAMDASVAAALVPFLETKNDAVRKRLAGWLELAANVTTRDETRPAFARGFLYLAARAAAVKAGRPVPPFASIEAKTDGPGVPPALKALILDAVRATDSGGEGFRGVDAVEGWPCPWLLRWARVTRPIAEDLPFLTEVSKAPKTLLASWAVRSLAALDPTGGKSAWPALATREDGVAVAVAAELARKGQPERLRSLADHEGDLAALAQVYSFEVDPDTARARYVASIAPEERERDPIDLSPFARAGYAVDWGVTIDEAQLARIGSTLAEGDPPRRGVVWFHAQVLPEAITPAVAAAMGRRLSALPDDLQHSFDIDTSELDLALAQLEVRAPDALRAVLEAWATGTAEQKKERALVHLARLGDASHVDAMLASFGQEAWSVAAPVLGRVKDPKVVTFLVERVRKDVDGEDADALAALAVARGLPESVRWLLSPGNDEGDHTEPLATVVTLLIEGDPRAAVVAFLAHGQMLASAWEVFPEGLEALRRARKERFFGGHPAYWTATKALAAAGDADARREWLAFLRDGRVRINDGEDLSVPRSLANDPEVLAVFLGLLDTNCCLGWQAYAALHEAFPTAPLGHIGPNLARNRVAAEPWFARHRGRFVWSRLLDAWLPGPAPR